MCAIVGALTAVLLAATVAVAAAQTIESGTVLRIDPQASVVVLDDGRMYRVTPGTVLVVESRPTPITALRPGQRVVIQSGEVVAPATAVPIGVRQTFYGTVADVDRDGEVKIRTERDSFEVRVAPEALRQIKKGDNVTIELTITPLGAPAASPATR
jgi:hypothetical protein